ncbi:MAG TPA: heavy metal-binding domain-containing protein [Xanthomonadaceae bacterium]|jgi:hypothetical protein
MGFLSWLTKGSDPAAKAAAQAAAEASAQRQAEIVEALRADRVPPFIKARLEGARDGALPWVATLTPAELRMARSHGIRPIAAVSATCWLHYGWSWTEGHAQGWESALRRLRAEALAVGANAVLDVKMRTVPIGIESSMDFSLVGTAVKIDGLPPSSDPIIATVPALEFVKLLEADVVPTGIAIGAHYEWMNDWQRSTNLRWMGNIESQALSQLWETVRHRAHAQLRASAASRGNGVLAHLNFSQMFERETENQPKQYLARHIVVATTVDGARDTRKLEDGKMTGAQRARLLDIASHRGVPVPHEFRMVVDLHAGGTPLTGTSAHHQSYSSNDDDNDDNDDDEGAI